MRELDDKKNELLAAYDLYADAIYRHVFFRVFQKNRAEELMQETFMKTWEYISKGNNIENTRAFLYKVANNLIIDNARKKKEESLDQILEENPGREPGYSGDKDIENQVLLKEVSEKIKYLEEEERNIITLRYFDDLDPKEIAEIIGISANNVSVKLTRALKKLREYL